MVKWLLMNLQWIVPIIISLLAIWLSFRNTRKQNEENHKPYLTVEDIVVSEKDLSSGYMICDNTDVGDIVDKTPYKMSITLRLRNIGYGIASAVKLMKVTDYNVVEVWTNEKDTNRSISIIDIAAGGSDEIPLLYYNYSKTRDVVEIVMILMFSDLYGNIFGSLLIITIDEVENGIYYTLYPEHTAHFKSVLSKNHIKYRELKNRYIYYIQKRQK